ncbi:MAG: CocE/NonD family hydrolase [Ferruginibacter sp.]
MRKYLIVMTLLAFHYCQAQDTLSADDFYKLSYKLPVGIDPADSVATDAFFSSSATTLFNDSKKFIDSPLKDSSLLNDVYYSLIYGAVFKKDYGAALKYLDKSRMLTFKKKFKVPPEVLVYAFIKAKLASGSSGSFDIAFEKALAEDLNKVDKDFIKDVANRLKGASSLEHAAFDRSEIAKYIKESLHDDSAVIMYNLPYLMEMFMDNYIAQKEYNVIQKVLNNFSPEVVIMENVKIPMKDGVLLNGYVYRSKDAKTPVLVSLSPYPGGNEAQTGNIFAVNGYAYLYVDNRGRRESGGTFFPYEDDAHDYYDIIDWASKQSWSNGKVATTGGSYLGFTQWQAIRKAYRHPALKAINPMASVGFGVDFPRDRNTFFTYILRWAELVKGKELNYAQFDNNKFWQQKEYELYKNNLPFAKFDSVAGLKNDFFTKWVQHPDFDAYWKNILPNQEDYATLNIPVLTTTGYYDGDQNGAMFYYRNLKQYNKNAQQYMIIGPYNHSGSQWMPGPVQDNNKTEDEAQIPLYKYVIQWFDWALKGKPLSPFFKNKVNYFNTGTGQWKSSASVDAIAKDTARFYLTSTETQSTFAAKLLSKTPDTKNEVFTYQHDIASLMDSVMAVSPSDLGNTKEVQASKRAFNKALVFETAPFASDILLGGNLSARLFLSLNVPDADIRMSFVEMDAKGKEKEIAYDLVRARYRNSNEKAELMKPGQISVLNFTHTFTYLKKIPAGNKLRIYIDVPNEPSFEKNYSFGGEVSKEATNQERIIEIKLYSGKEYPSCLLVPVQ